jgi:hypothetical protein
MSIPFFSANRSSQTRQETALPRCLSSKFAARGHDLARASALQTLMEPIKGKTRKLYVFDREMMLLDKAGGVAIEEVDDPTAVHYFLQWLHGQRELAEVRKSSITKHRTGSSLKGGV